MIDRGRLLFGSVTSTVVGAVGWDRWECDRIRRELRDQAKALGERPIHDPLALARHLEVYLSAASKKEVNTIHFYIKFYIDLFLFLY